MRGAFAGWLAIAALALSSVAAAQAPQRVELDVAGALTIDEQGAVRGYDIAGGRLPADITHAIGEAVKQWKFEPIVRDGHAVVAQAPMYLLLSANPEQGGYRMKVERVQFGVSRKPSAFKGGMSSHYPREAMRMGVGADVMVAMRIDAAGNVLEATPVRSRLVPGMPKGKEKLDAYLRKLFEEGVTSLMTQARFEPADPARGDQAVTSLVMPVTFLMQPRQFTPLWTQADAAVTATPPAWLRSGLAPDAVDRLKDGQSLAVDGDFVLLTPIVGKAL